MSFMRFRLILDLICPEPRLSLRIHPLLPDQCMCLSHQLHVRASDGVIFNSLPLGAGQLEPVLSFQHLLPSLSPFAALEGAAGLGFRLGRGGDPEPSLALSSSSPSPQGMEYSKARGISRRMLSED